jgi:hypothetical protein
MTGVVPVGIASTESKAMNNLSFSHPRSEVSLSSGVDVTDIVVSVPKQK